MAQFTPKQVSDPSSLTHGRHPGFLLAVLVEEIPEAFIEMKKKDTHMFRWYLAIWEHLDHMQQYAPEQQSAISSRAFSPKGKFQASKAYVWIGALMGHDIPKGQGFDIDPYLPLACLVDVERVPGNDYCKIAAIWGRPEGQATIPPVVHQLRAQYATGFPPPQGNGHATQQAAPTAQGIGYQPAQQPQTYGTPPAYTPPPAHAAQPDNLCQHLALPGGLVQPGGHCGHPAVTLLAGHRICAAHKAQVEAKIPTGQPAAAGSVPF